MRAAVYLDREDIRLLDVALPRPAPDEVLLRVHSTGICGTDASEFARGPFLYSIRGRHPVSGHSGPLIPGHEITGSVVELGRDVVGLSTDDLVASGGGVSCGLCAACCGGRSNLCPSYWTVGLQRNGGLAEYCALPADTCVPLAPYELTLDAATLAQPMAIAAHAVRRGRVEATEVVAVVGVGGIGAFVTYAAAAAGALVVASDLDRGRRELAISLGATFVADPSGDDLQVVLAGAGLKASVVFEVSGTPQGLRAAVKALQPGARLVIVGLQDEPSPIDLREVALAECELIGTVAHVCAVDLPEALRLLARRRAGWADVCPLALPLERLVEEGLRPLVDGRSSRVKTIIDPHVRQTRQTIMALASIGSGSLGNTH
ncbi:MAG TPA: alcohol dehydrogenase catalytic domain-containing protein [Candidatus Limnocylindria bacterium]|nr:alcohol dehydrogenase catalytic domain-containing protein [Candidatus Limnocylindria bacterium]